MCGVTEYEFKKASLVRVKIFFFFNVFSIPFLLGRQHIVRLWLGEQNVALLQPHFHPWLGSLKDIHK